MTSNDLNSPRDDRRRARRRRASLVAWLELLWLPLAVGIVLGATIASVVHGTLWKQLAIGALAGGWVTLCLAGYLALYDRWLGGGRTGARRSGSPGR